MATSHERIALVSESGQPSCALCVSELAVLSSRVGDLNDNMQRVLDGISKVPVIEERQTQMAATLGRAFDQIDAQGVRLAVLEQAQPESKRVTAWVDRGMWAAAAAAVTFLAKKAGLL